MPRMSLLLRRGRGVSWLYGLTAVAVVLFAVALAVRLSCVSYGCVGSSAERVLNLDGMAGLPRVFTTGLLVASAATAFWISRRRAGGSRRWWELVVLVGVGLALAKVFSAHSAVKVAGPVVALLTSLLLTVVVLTVLRVTARLWRVSVAAPVITALGLYALAALGLDAVTAAAAGLGGEARPAAVAVATFVEELGEALAAILLLWRVLEGQPPGAARLDTYSVTSVDPVPGDLARPHQSTTPATSGVPSDRSGQGRSVGDDGRDR